MCCPSDSDNSSTSETSKALHTIATHLHRYKTETDILADVVSRLTACDGCSCASKPNDDGHSSFQIIAGEVNGLQMGVDELERKTRTIIGLVSKARKDFLVSKHAC